MDKEGSHCFSTIEVHAIVHAPQPHYKLLHPRDTEDLDYEAIAKYANDLLRQHCNMILHPMDKEGFDFLAIEVYATVHCLMHFHKPYYPMDMADLDFSTIVKCEYDPWQQQHCMF
jgi:hypothetical protein